jgi:hypothetical protein
MVAASYENDQNYYILYILYKVSTNDCQVKLALEIILLCRLFETDAQFIVNCHFRSLYLFRYI